MIRTDTEHRAAVARLKEEGLALKKHREELVAAGLSEEEVKNLMDPFMSAHIQLKEEVDDYVGLKQKKIPELTNLRSIGHLLICARIASGLSQAQLAERLEVSPSQVSRDERNEYRGITVERAAKVIDVLGAKTRTTCEIPEECTV